MQKLETSESKGVLHGYLTFLPRKQELHHLKQLQLEEIKLTTEFYNHIKTERE